MRQENDLSLNFVLYLDLQMKTLVGRGEDGRVQVPIGQQGGKRLPEFSHFAKMNIDCRHPLLLED